MWDSVADMGLYGMMQRYGVVPDSSAGMGLCWMVQMVRRCAGWCYGVMDCTTVIVRGHVVGEITLLSNFS